MMFFRSFFSGSLRTHAILISAGLIALTALLGIRAYTVGRGQFLESKELLEREIPVQTLLFQIQGAKAGVEQARKKWRITGDPAYSQLVAKHLKVQQKSEAELRRIWPGAVTDGHIAGLQARIAADGEEKIRHARDTAMGLLRLIIVALGLSFLMTAWISLFFYKGLTLPLEKLSSATKRIRGGDLSHRIDPRGVAELQDLGASFNSMAERLESLDRAKQSFLAMISHEIKNPIAALKEGLSLLSAPEKHLAPETQKRCISACLIASKRLEYMINNLLSLSRSESGLFDYEFSKHSLESVLQSSVSEVRPIAEKKGMQIRVSCPEGLLCSLNWEAMMQAFVNLLLNAIKYGAESTAIEIVARISDPATGRVQVSVANSGKEISPAELKRIFEPFYRGQNSAKQQGMGVGLHIVKRIVEAHRGFVSALSEAGKTQMILTFPGESA